MPHLSLEFLPAGLLSAYVRDFPPGCAARFVSLRDSEISTGEFSFYTSVSAVFSSRIEGEDIELDSYIKHRRGVAHFQPNYTRRIDDLYEACRLARDEPLTLPALHSAHALLTRHILEPSGQGRWRPGNMFVMTPDGRIEYAAAGPQAVPGEMERLFADVARLQEAALTFAESFFFAALLHLAFVKIHPYEDGNGRTGRLLEKWFLSRKLGPQAWLVPSERHYYENHALYYRNIRRLRLEYDELDYREALPFLLMLPQSLEACILPRSLQVYE